MKIYISGKITGTTDYMERFQITEEKLAAEGHIVFNPASVNSMMPAETSYEEYMKISFCLLDMAELIYMMSGWESSPGAQRELHYASAKGITVYFEDSYGSEKHFNNVQEVRDFINGQEVK